jgi:hypothetical protein
MTDVARLRLRVMLGLPINSWLRFFALGFVAGALMRLTAIPPLALLGVFEMIAAAAGLVVVASYARLYRRREWTTLLVRGRRMARTLGEQCYRLGRIPAAMFVRANRPPLRNDADSAQAFARQQFP